MHDRLVNRDTGEYLQHSVQLRGVYHLVTTENGRRTLWEQRQDGTAWWSGLYWKLVTREQ